jgi:hypothetical protein
VTTPKKPTRSRRSRTPARGRKPRATEIPPSPEPLAEAEVEATAPDEAPAASHEPLPTVDVEPFFVARVPPPGPRQPLPSVRRAVFFDVENTSRAEHVSRVLRHLALDWQVNATELIAVGNWRVIGHDAARLLARHGAHLVHSAPSVGVRDWSDLRIAVAAGAWLAATRPGDTLEIVTDDQAFDAVGDVAASLGVVFRRLSYRALAGAGEIQAEEPARDRSPSRRRRRGGRRGGRGPVPPPRHAPVVHEPIAANGHAEEEPHTAPHDELLAVARELIEASHDRSVSLDALSNALKERGFSRPPGSPRLVTRLRRIKELEVGRQGTIRLVAASDADTEEAPPTGDDASPGDSLEPAAEPTAEASTTTPTGQRRRRRRGGRRRRGRGGSQASAGAPADAGS